MNIIYSSNNLNTKSNIMSDTRYFPYTLIIGLPEANSLWQPQIDWQTVVPAINITKPRDKYQWSSQPKFASKTGDSKTFHADIVDFFLNAII